MSAARRGASTPSNHVMAGRDSQIAFVQPPTPPHPPTGRSAGQGKPQRVLVPASLYTSALLEREGKAGTMSHDRQRAAATNETIALWIAFRSLLPGPRMAPQQGRLRGDDGDMV
jgi:hypothetical protein